MPTDPHSLIAPPGSFWVCHACGKTSRHRYGDIGAMPGWDSSCAMQAGLYREDQLVRGADGRVVELKEADGNAE